MKVLPGHLLEGAHLDILPGGEPMPVRRCLVVHFTAGATGQSTLDYWRSPEAKGACAHLLIERDGRIIQCRAFNRTAGHAGVSRWNDPNTARRYEGLNAFSIGIELANAGNSRPALNWARRQRGFHSLNLRHRNGGAMDEWETFPDAQILAAQEVARVLVARYRLDDITGHDCIAPERKQDPGPAFPMAIFREFAGFHGLPVVFRA